LKSLAVLQRLAKQAVDQERQVLLAIGNEIATVEAEIEGLRQAIDRESAASHDFRSSGATLHAFIQAGKGRIRQCEERLLTLQQAHAVQLERVQQQRVEEKRYERLAERRAEQIARDEAMKEQKAIDELAVISKRRV
jgi:flagellar export protein FliJ